MPNKKTAPRQLDEIGRIVIPANIREELEWDVGTTLEVSIKDNKDNASKSIIMKEVTPCCSLCRKSYENLERIEKGYMCPDCLEKIMWRCFQTDNNPAEPYIQRGCLSYV